MHTSRKLRACMLTAPWNMEEPLVFDLRRWLLLRREAGGIEQRQKHVNVLMYGEQGVGTRGVLHSHCATKRSPLLFAQVVVR